MAFRDFESLCETRLSRLARRSGTINVIATLFRHSSLLFHVQNLLPSVTERFFILPFLFFLFFFSYRMLALFSLLRFRKRIVKRQSSLWWGAIKLYLASADLTRGTVKMTNITGRVEVGGMGFCYCCDRVLSLIHSTTRNRETLESCRSRI